MKIAVEHLEAVNYAIVHNNVPVCSKIEVGNTTSADIRNFQLFVEGEYICPASSSVYSSLGVGCTMYVKDLEVKPDPRKLSQLTERISSSFDIVVKADGAELARQSFSISLMAFDQWLGTTLMPQTLASFIMPNVPEVNALVVKAAAVLKAQTGSSSLTGYLSGDINTVLQQVAAVYKALCNEGIIYRVAPPSYEAIGQRINLPAQVLKGKIGNCIELTILMASVLENIGLHPIVIIAQGHAYLGVWLVEDSYSHSIGDDASFLEKKASKGISEIAVIECTSITSEGCSFEDAVKGGMRQLSDLANFVMFLDIHRCRLEHYLPLPVVTGADGSMAVDVEGVEHGNSSMEVSHHTRYDLQKIAVDDSHLTRLDIWERKLLDFSLRNAMLNLYVRSKAIQIVSFDVDKIEDHLQDGDEYCITYRPDVPITIDAEARIQRSKQFTNLQPLISNDVQHNVLHSYLTETETKTILKNIHRAAKVSIEETGANSLFLAIGTLRWYETDISTTPRYAPILLMPVEMVYKKGNYYIRTRGEDIILNITLMEFLRQNYNITVKGLSPLPSDGHGVDVSLIFAILRDLLKDQKHWDIEEECLLGTFSFSKYLMWNDIHNNRELLLKNPIIESLVSGHLTWQPKELEQNIGQQDHIQHPSAMALPVPVDSSQMKAVYEAGQGNSFILYGPPGTGKSQTITNLIANALFQGKRVLFVAEKMAALSVVQSRLEKIGLAPFCLELHSNKTTKKHILEQLSKSLSVTHIQRPEDYQKTADELFQQRTKLLAFMDAVHTPGADGFSLFDCIVRYESLEGVEPLHIESTSGITGLNINTLKDYEYQLDSLLATVVGLVGQPSQHPLRDFIIDKCALNNTSAVQTSLEQCLQLVDSLLAKSGGDDVDTALQLLDALDNAASLTGAPLASIYSAHEGNVLKEYAALRGSYQSKRQAILSKSREEIFSQDIVALQLEWHTIQNKWFIPRFFSSRSFVKRLQFFAPSLTKADVGSFLDDVLACIKTGKALDDQQPQVRASLSSLIPLQDVKERLTRWIANLNLMRDWYQWCDYRSTLLSMNMDVVVKTIESRSIDVSTMRDAFVRGYFMTRCSEKIAASEVLGTFEGSMFDEQVKRYKSLTSEFQTLCTKELYARLAANVPRLTDNLDNSSEIGILSRNISNGGRGLSVRDLFDQIPSLMPLLSPCMLMSPMSVAQYINLSQKPFDLVIFDEASQMPTSEAVGAIARGTSLIVVGDPKQMPPTSFFSSTNVDEDEADIDDLESILEDCRTLGIPSLQLSWHYRSKHESLIAFSNNEYYDGSLITFPSTDDKQTKVNFVPVKGFYDKGGKRCNKAEAEAIVKEVVHRLRDDELRKHSIGVIAFSVVQQNMIEDLLTEALESDRSLGELADSMYEPIFVKNLENVQGDERDVILFSIGYGPDREGKVSMNFGPLNNAGGERRLNVAVSRARRQMIVYSTLHAAQIDLRRTQSKGVEGLKHFLEYAEFQTISQYSSDHQSESDAIIAGQIAKALQQRGYEVQMNVGRSQFRVDVAIADKKNAGAYSLGILLDGEKYRDTQTIRDREVVQPSVLEALSWRVMRVWTVDWLTNPDRVLDRIEKAYASAPEQQPVAAINAPFDISQEKEEVIATNAADYQRYSGTTRLTIPKLVERVVATEQPIQLSLLCKRIAELTDKPRVTPTIIADVKACLIHYYRVPDRDTETICDSESTYTSYTNYRPATGRDILDIPMLEVENAVLEVVSQQISLAADNATLVAAKLLGFTRRGTNVDLAFRTAISNLVDNGRLVLEDGKLRIC